MKKVLLAALLLSVVYGCKTVPITGRKQFIAIPAVAMNSLGASAFQDVRASVTLSSNTEQVAMIERVGRRITQAVEEYFASQNMSSALNGFSWEFILIDDPVVNAWCMPGGRVAFYTGILPVCANEDGIAVVMGHEIAHAVANHGAERMTQSLMAQMGGVALAVALSEQPETTQQLALAAFGVGSQVFGLLPYSRKHEYEADRLGLIFASMAGYDATEGPKFWERMMALSRNPSASDFLSTHPSNAKRIRELKSVIPEANTYFQPKLANTTKWQYAPGSRTGTTTTTTARPARPTR